MKYLIAPLIALVLSVWFALPTMAQAPITYTLTSPGGDFIFTTIRSSSNWLLIADSTGSPVFERSSAGSFGDLKVQQGKLVYYSGTTDQWEVLNEDYQLIDTWQTVGYPIDAHDIQLLDNGGALLMVYREFPYDLSPWGGLVTATVVSCIIQEINPDKSLAWQWDGWDHNPLTDTNRSLTTARVDYDHCNAVEQDDDGNVLYSSRHLDQITKIDRQTGAVIWKLGGKSNQFTFTNDAGFALQHDIRRIGNGHITLFDNGQPARGYSRAVEYEIDETGKVITRTWEYRGPFAFCCGNAQRLENGNTFINFGPGHPTMREVTPDGVVVFEADTEFSYRSFRLPWRRRWYLPIIWDSSAGSRQ